MQVPKLFSPVELEESKSRDGLENDNPEINKEEICGISGEQDIFFTIEGAYGNVEVRYICFHENGSLSVHYFDEHFLISNP